jgi:hypothetical protein
MGINVSYATELTIDSSILWGNAAPEQIGYDGSATIFVSNSCIQGLNTYAGNGNIGEDPLFLNAAGGDFHLSAASPCIDAGNPDFTPDPSVTDIDGQPRLMSCRLDMGADEFFTGQAGSADYDGSGHTDAGDIPHFVQSLLAITNLGRCVGDLNADEHIDGADIQAFVTMLTAP